MTNFTAKQDKFQADLLEKELLTRVELNRLWPQNQDNTEFIQLILQHRHLYTPERFRRFEHYMQELKNDL